MGGGGSATARGDTAVEDALVATAAGFGSACGDPVGLRLELVRKRLERLGVAPRRVGERLRQHPIGEPRVAREQRAMEVRADRAADATAFVPALAVVAEAGDHTAERFRAVVEMRPARLVLEAGKRSPDAGVELALEQDVTDHPPLTGDGFEREKPDSRQVRAVKVTV